MADSDGEELEKLTFKFLRGVEADADELEWPAGADIVRKALSESLNAKNVAFLLGAGCSSYYVKETNDVLGDDWREVGIPTMAPLAEEFTKARAAEEAGFPTAAERKAFADEFGIDIADKEYGRNLERLMELLFSLRFTLSRSALPKAKDNLKVVNSIIQKVQAFLWGKCTNGAFANGDRTVGLLYETFYRKLVLRDC
ncbi:hypothetical protein [Agrobacterium leguminum]|uniref:hypothetical protein n=1 Tax=Agrobacterium leguminum TaxID=2792015 RepID=UPI003CE51533